MTTQRVLLTGMSGTGKSTVIAELAARGHRAVDLDQDAWSEWVDVAGDPTVERDWIWREDRVRQLLATETDDLLFVSGCASNQGRFYPRFDHIILLSAPTPLLLARLVARTNNPYGQQPHELAEVLYYIETVEPLLRRRATLEIDTSAPLDQVVAAVLNHVLGRPG